MGAQEREESMQKSRKVHPFEKRLRLLEEALEHKMDKTDGENLEERVSDLESNHEELELQLSVSNLNMNLHRAQQS
jgi:hypothetical protein